MNDASKTHRTVSRRPARVFAMELLYAMEITGQPVGKCVDGVLDSICEKKRYEMSLVDQRERERREKEIVEMKRYGMSLVDLVQEHRAILDEIISDLSKGWDLDRLALLDKIILYISLTEIQYEPEIPVKVAIGEAVQIANKFSTENSYRFINGILNQFARSKGMLHDKPEDVK